MLCLQAAKAARRGVQRRPPVCALVRGQLYAAVAHLAMLPLQPGAAVSCKVSRSQFSCWRHCSNYRLSYSQPPKSDAGVLLLSQYLRLISTGTLLHNPEPTQPTIAACLHVRCPAADCAAAAACIPVP